MKKIIFHAGLALLLGTWMFGSFLSRSQAESGQTLDLQEVLRDHVLANGFIASEPLQGVGFITGSQDERGNLSEGDLIYIKLESNARVKAGDRFYVARFGREINHPVTGQKMGHLVRFSGIAVILDGAGQVVPARIQRSFFPVRYGDMAVAALGHLPPRMPIRFPEKIKGTIVASPEEEENITEREVVYIDRGTQDGLILGDLFTIYQMPYYTSDTRTGNLPLLNVGEGIVVFVNRNNATMLVTKSSQAIYVGDTIVSGKGK